jgi:hypothetical protein
MRRYISFFLLVLALVAGSAAQSAGQVQIQADDTLYDLRGVYSPDQPEYIRLVALNPILGEPGRAFIDSQGRFIVILREGESLNTDGLEIVIPEVVSITEVFPPEATPSITLVQAATPVAPLYQSSWFPWLLLVIAILGVMAWRNRRFFSNPATSGVPVITGGITPDQPGAVEDRFQAIANRRYVSVDPTANLERARPRRVGEIRRGTLTGIGRVEYAGGRSEMRRLNRDQAYQADFRFPDGYVEPLTFLQECANDVTYGGTRYIGFTFTPEQGEPVMPIPEPTPAVPIHAVAADATTLVDMTTTTHAGMQISAPVGSTLDTMGDGMSLTVKGPCTIVLRKARGRQQPRAAKPAATGTDDK